MGFNYFPDLNHYFKTLYSRNQAWFRYRDQLSVQEQQQLFQAFMSMDEGLQEVSRILLQKEKAPPLSDARNRV